jgi:hypothetical protein
MASGFRIPPLCGIWKVEALFMTPRVLAVIFYLVMPKCQLSVRLIVSKRQQSLAVDIGPERWRHCCTLCKLHSAVVHLMQQLTTAALAVTQCNTANKEHSPTIYKYAMSASRRLISHPTGFPPVLTAPSHHAAVLINTKTLVNLRSIVHCLLC